MLLGHFWHYSHYNIRLPAAKPIMCFIYAHFHFYVFSSNYLPSTPQQINNMLSSCDGGKVGSCKKKIKNDKYWAHFSAFLVWR